MSDKKSQSNILSTSERDKLLKKLFSCTVGLRDLKIVRSCLNDLKEIPIDNITETNNVGKMITFFVCYGRIFQDNKEVGRIKLKHTINALPLEEKQLHEWLLERRNKCYAHNDPEDNHLFISYISGEQKFTAIAQITYHPLSYNHEITTALIKHIQTGLEKERDKILSKLWPTQPQTPESYLVTFGFNVRRITDKG